jgi:hypothetical protein
MEEEICEEGKEEDPLKDDSNTQTQNLIVIFGNSCPSATSGIIDNNECCLDILYDNALDAGPILIDNSPCIHEDKNDDLASSDDALIHESSILFLKSPIYIIEENMLLLRSTYVVCNFLMNLIAASGR